LCADPQYKAEGGFKTGYLVKLESMMKARCPESGLKANPHIYSKTKWFRDKYNVLNEMVCTSGFSWDDTTKMIKCERQSIKRPTRKCTRFKEQSSNCVLGPKLEE